MYGKNRTRYICVVRNQYLTRRECDRSCKHPVNLIHTREVGALERFVCRGDQPIKINSVVKIGGDQYIGGPTRFKS